MSTRTTIEEAMPEKATAYIGATITDIDGVTALASADTVLTTLTVTLCLDRFGTAINSRAAQSVLNVNGGTVSSAGVLSLRLDPLDMIIVSGRTEEKHLALFEWTWGSPLKGGKHEVAFTVTNLLKVT
jgi:hypothetical protein